jgi:hypothetical protein
LLPRQKPDKKNWIGDKRMLRNENGGEEGERLHVPYTWKVEAVERKRVERFPHTKAEDAMPERIPNADARRPSGTLSACSLR